MPSALPAGALVIDEDDDDDSPPPLSPADVDPRAADDDAALAASLGSALRNAPPQPSAAAAVPDIAFAGSATWGSERRQGTLCAVGALLALLVILVSGHHTLGGGGAACPASNHSAAVTRVLVLGSREPGCPCFEKPAAWGVQARALPDNATRLVGAALTQHWDLVLPMSAHSYALARKAYLRCAPRLVAAMPPHTQAALGSRKLAPWLRHHGLRALAPAAADAGRPAEWTIHFAAFSGRLVQTMCAHSGVGGVGKGAGARWVRCGRSPLLQHQVQTIVQHARLHGFGCLRARALADAAGRAARRPGRRHRPRDRGDALRAARVGRRAQAAGEPGAHPRAHRPRRAAHRLLDRLLDRSGAVARAVQIFFSTPSTRTRPTGRPPE